MTQEKLPHRKELCLQSDPTSQASLEIGYFAHPRLYLRKSLCFAEHVLRTYDFLDKHP